MKNCFRLLALILVLFQSAALAAPSRYEFSRGLPEWAEGCFLVNEEGESLVLEDLCKTMPTRFVFRLRASASWSRGCWEIDQETGGKRYRMRVVDRACAYGPAG